MCRLLADPVLPAATEVVLEPRSASRGCSPPPAKPDGFPGIYGNPRFFLAPSDAPTTVVVSSTTTSSTLVTVSVTVGVVTTVTSNGGDPCVDVEVSVSGIVVVSPTGLVTTTDVLTMLEITTVSVF